MNWLNIELRSLRSEAFVGSEPTDRATWLCLMAYCADQENGGRIAGAASWGDRKWMQLVGVTKEETRRQCPLWTWKGDDLIVAMYPVDKEAVVIGNRKNGGTGGQARTEAKTQAARANGQLGGRPITQAETQAETQAITQRKGIGKEGKGIGREEEHNTPSMPPLGGDDTEKTTSEKPAKAPAPAEIHDREVPSFIAAAGFATEEVRNLFAEWMQERRRARKYATGRAARMALDKLAGYPAEVQAAALKDAIAGNWRGVFPEKTRMQRPTADRTAEKVAKALEMWK